MLTDACMVTASAPPESAELYVKFEFVMKHTDCMVTLRTPPVSRAELLRKAQSVKVMDDFRDSDGY